MTSIKITTLVTALGALSMTATWSCGGPTEAQLTVTEEALEMVERDGWELVSQEEVAAARERTDLSFRRSLGAQAVMITDGRVYRRNDVFDIDVDGLDLSELSYPGSDGDDGAFGSTRSSVIVGADNRVPITGGLTSTPNRQVGRITVGLQSGATFVGLSGCSGTKIGPRHVLTSGHCFAAFANAVRYQPAVSGPTAPFPTIASQTFIVYGSGDTTDLALVILPHTRLSSLLGFRGLRAPSSSEDGNSITIRGYPGASQICSTAPASSFPTCGGFLYRSSCTITEVDEEVEYPCDTSGGMSGSGVLDSGLSVIAVHKGSDDDLFDDENRGVRITPLWFAVLCGQMENFQPGPCF